MLFTKTYNSSIVSAIVLCTFIASTSKTDEFDDLLNDLSVENFIQDNTWTRSQTCTPNIIAPILVDAGIIPVLEQNFYLKTSELTNRSLLDYPLFLPRRWNDYQKTVGFEFFWNKTDRMFFTENSSALCSYLNLGPSALLDALTASFEKIIQTGLVPNTQLQPATIFPLLRNFTVEQRRTGVMFHAEKRTGKTFLYCFVPIYYIERNMFASEIEQEALARVFGRMDQASESVFAKRHLISDKIGLGDTRVSIDFQLKDSDVFGFNLGFFMTLPTAFAFAKNIQGSTFTRVSCPPQINILDLACTLQEGTVKEKEAAIATATNFAFAALDNLSAHLLETPLGNGGHVGVGFAFLTDSYLQTFISRPWAQAIDFRNRLSLEYLIPKTGCRSFLQCNRLEEFAALGLNLAPELVDSRLTMDEAYANTVLDFFNQQIMQEFFPFTFQARVHPGFIFRSTSKTYHDSNQWYFAMGNDLWVQSNERLDNLQIPQECGALCSPNGKTLFDIAAAERKFAYQGKIWGTVAYKIVHENIDWILSLNIDQTYLNSGIGSDYTVTLGFEANF